MRLEIIFVFFMEKKKTKAKKKVVVSLEASDIYIQRQEFHNKSQGGRVV
jgi:hypothetical protein